MDKAQRWVVNVDGSSMLYAGGIRVILMPPKGDKFKEASFVQLPRKENMEANALAKAASAGRAMDEYDKVQYMPSIDLPEVQQIE